MGHPGTDSTCSAVYSRPRARLLDSLHLSLVLRDAARRRRRHAGCIRDASRCGTGRIRTGTRSTHTERRSRLQHLPRDVCSAPAECCGRSKLPTPLPLRPQSPPSSSSLVERTTDHMIQFDTWVGYNSTWKHFKVRAATALRVLSPSHCMPLLLSPTRCDCRRRDVTDSVG